MTRIGCPMNYSACTLVRGEEEFSCRPAKQHPPSHPEHRPARCEARLAYDDEKTALAFLKTVFGLQEQARMRGPDDSFINFFAADTPRFSRGEEPRPPC